MIIQILAGLFLVLWLAFGINDYIGTPSYVRKAVDVVAAIIIGFLYSLGLYIVLGAVVALVALTLGY